MISVSMTENDWLLVQAALMAKRRWLAVDLAEECPVNPAKVRALQSFARVHGQIARQVERVEHPGLGAVAAVN